MDAGIIGAMEEEIRLLKSRIENIRETEGGGCRFYSGTLEGLDVVLLQSGIGKVNAAIGTTLLIERFKPKVIINTGSAGGTHHSLEIGDIIISTELRHHDVDVTAFGYDYGQVPKMPSSFIPHDDLIDIAEKVIDKIEGVSTHKGLIGTGDSFMSDPDQIHVVRKKMPDLLAVEMEGASIAQVCHQFNVPFLVIRSISDIAGKESPVSFEKFLETAARHSAEMVLEILRELRAN
jgi:adenosylhomocysteine nucleosidase